MIYRFLARLPRVVSFAGRIMEARGQYLLHKHPAGTVPYRTGHELWLGCVQHRNWLSNMKNRRGARR